MGWSSFFGTTIEYYDFLLYGAAATVIFNKIFFPALDPVLGTIAALATLAVGYLARLAGGLLFGHYGDRYGRKSVLVVTMLVMGVSSGLIGLLPTYAQIGPASGILLLVLRIVQGLAVGGEFGGAVLMTAEHSRPGHRAIATSAVTMGAPAGSVLATGTMALITLLPEDQLLAWGWRVPFLFSFVLLGIGLYLRYRIAESPVFLELQQTAPRGGLPLAVLLRRHWKRVVWGVAIAAGPFCGQGVLFIYIASYATSIGYTRPEALFAVTVGTIISVATAALFAALADRIGRRPVVLYGAISTAVVVFPFFWLINMHSTVALGIALGVYVPLVMIAALSVMPVLLSELFDTEVRYTGVSLAYQFAQAIGSGVAPLVAAALLVAAGGGTQVGLVAAFVVAVCAISAIAIWRVPETQDVELAAAGREGEPVKR